MGMYHESRLNCGSMSAVMAEVPSPYSLFELLVCQDPDFRFQFCPLSMFRRGMWSIISKNATRNILYKGMLGRDTYNISLESPSVRKLLVFGKIRRLMPVRMPQLVQSCPTDCPAWSMLTSRLFWSGACVCESSSITTRSRLSRCSPRERVLEYRRRNVPSRRRTDFAICYHNRCRQFHCLLVNTRS